MSDSPRRALSAGASRRVALTARTDDGVTLVELIVAMSVFLVLTTVVVSSVVGSTRTLVSTASVATSAEQTRRAYERLDRQVRYAESINRPVIVVGRQYVEMRTTAVPAGKPPRCDQWRYDSLTGRLETRSWADDPAAVPQGWTTVAAGLRVGADALPVLTFVPVGKSQQQGLRVVLQGAVSSGRTPVFDSTFMARNSSDASTTNKDANNDGISDAQVCMQGGRP